MILADQIKDLEQRSGALERCLNIEQKRIDLLNEEEKTQVPDFWDNPDQAREQLRRVAAIKAWVDDYDAVAKDVEDLALMPEFVKEGVVSEQEMDAHYAQTLERIEKLEMRNTRRAVFNTMPPTKSTYAVFSASFTSHPCSLLAYGTSTTPYILMIHFRFPLRMKRYTVSLRKTPILAFLSYLRKPAKARTASATTLVSFCCPQMESIVTSQMSLYGAKNHF